MSRLVNGVRRATRLAASLTPRSVRAAIGALVLLLVPLMSILAIHTLDANARQRMDASRLVSAVESTADELAFLEWQGLAGTLPQELVAGQISSLRKDIDTDLGQLRSDGVDASTVAELRASVRAFSDAITGDSVKVSGGHLDILSKGTLNVLVAYQRIHSAADEAHTALASQTDAAALLQDIGSTVLILAACAIVTFLVWRVQRRRRAADVARAEADMLRDREHRLRHQAFHDELTDLPNRALFHERLHHALSRSHRTGLHCAVILLDLDDFKTVNDSLGHAAGDELLAGVASRIASCIRPGDTIARLGGDEFGVVVEDVPDVHQATSVADRIVVALREPFVVLEAEMDVTASMGITVADAAGTSTPESLVRDADVAMYAAKSRGGGTWAVFGADMHRSAQQRLELRSALGRATDNGELVLHYQPVVSLATRQVVGVEALVRWEHPNRGLIGPADFIHLAEETGRVVAVGQHVLAESAAQLHRWERHVAGAAEVELSVNVSFRELVDEDFVASTLRIVDCARLDPRRLTLEVTESMLMQEPERAIRTLQLLRDHGIRIAMDDFGSGYSSLAYLRQLPLDTVKIDRSFVMSIGGGNEDLSMTLAIVRLLSTLNVLTVAEGIETPEQLDYVSAMGCDRGQGFLFAPPLPADGIAVLLQAHTVATVGATS